MKIKIKKLHPDALIPTYAKPGIIPTGITFNKKNLMLLKEKYSIEKTI
jgi:hypothetical protein